MPHGPLNGSSQFGPDVVAGPAFVDDDQVHTWGHPCSGVRPQQYLVDVHAGIRHHGRVEQDAHRGAVCIRFAIAGAAQLLRVGAGERGVRVEVLPVEHPRVAAAETLQVGLPGPAYRHVGSRGDENRCGGSDSVQAGTRAGSVGVCGELAARPRGTQRLDDAVLPVHRVGVDGQATAVVGDADRSVGVQGDGDGGPAVARDRRPLRSRCRRVSRSAVLSTSRPRFTAGRRRVCWTSSSSVMSAAV